MDDAERWFFSEVSTMMAIVLFVLGLALFLLGSMAYIKTEYGADIAIMATGLQLVLFGAAAYHLGEWLDE